MVRTPHPENMSGASSRRAKSWARSGSTMSQYNACPGFRGVRTADYAYFELATGERELYDLTGASGPPNPFELENRAGSPAYAKVQKRLAARLAQLSAG